MSYEFDRESRVLRTTCTGQVKLEEVLAHFLEVEADETLPPRLDVLLDLSATDTTPDAGQIKSVSGAVGRVAKTVTWGHFAIVASRDAMFGMARMLQIFSEDYFEDARVFRDHAEAERWLHRRCSSAAPEEDLR